MNKYQEALNFLKKIEAENNYKRIGLFYHPQCDTLQELVDAWEVIKIKLELTIKEDDFAYYWLIYNPCELLEIEKKDYEIIKKALEVEND